MWVFVKGNAVALLLVASAEYAVSETKWHQAQKWVKRGNNLPIIYHIFTRPSKLIIVIYVQLLYYTYIQCTKQRAWHWYNFSLDDRKVGFLDRKSRQAMAWLENVGHQFYDWWVGHPLYNATRTFANTFPKISSWPPDKINSTKSILFVEILSQYILFVRKPIAMSAKDKIALSTFPDVAPLLVLPPLPVQLPYFLLPPQMCHNTGWHSVVVQVSVGQLEITTKT